mgnify:CR=1 FL=1
MTYELSIEGEAGTINLNENGTGNSAIKKVDFQIAQDNLETNEKATSLFNTLVIEGEITDKTQSQTKELLEWSLKTDKTNVYKTVSLVVRKDADVIRDYYLKDMFCTSYQEFFDEDTSKSNSNGKFVLKMRQRKGSIDTIVVDC